MTTYSFVLIHQKISLKAKIISKDKKSLKAKTSFLPHNLSRNKVFSLFERISWEKFHSRRLTL